MRNKLIHYIALCCIILTACSKEDAVKDTPASPDSDGVEAILNLTLQAIQAPAPTTKSSTEYNTPNVLAACREGAMSTELLAGQSDVGTRVENEVDESAIDNLWVFQFNGTGNDATLVRKIYKTDLINNPNIRFISGNNQRIVALANSFNPALADELTVGTSTYSALSTLTNTIGTTINGFIPMNGILDTNIPVTSETPLTFTIPLKRNVAKITLKVKLATDYPTGTWSAQMCSTAPDYWFPSSGTEVFPTIADNNTSAYTDLTATDFTFNTDATVNDGYTILTWLVPVNRRGTVDGTTGITRKTNAPTEATYIKLLYKGKEDNVINHSVERTNYIHLGANFTTDYNVCGNTHYTYKVTLYPDKNEDSRIENVYIPTSEYVGMFGGKLTNTNGVWQFTEKLWIQDDETLVTTNNWVDASVKDKFDGKTNTLAMAKAGKTVICIQKNTGLTVDVSTNIDNPAYRWYMPAQGQLIAAWIASNSFQKKLNNKYYWSSTSNGNNISWFMFFQYGYISATNLKGGNNDAIRCVNGFNDNKQE